MTDTQTPAQVLRDRLNVVIGYESRIAALRAALAEDGSDTATAIFLSDRIAEREKSLAEAHDALGEAIEAYRAARADQVRRTVESIPVAVTR